MSAVLQHLAETLLAYIEPDDNEICVNHPGGVWIDRPSHKPGMLYQKAPNITLSWLNNFSSTLAGSMDATIHKGNPILSAYLPSGERVQIVMPPACQKDQFIVSVRRQTKQIFSYDAYTKTDYFSKAKVIKNAATYKKEMLENDSVLKLAEQGEIATALRCAVQQRKSIVLCGKMSSGKTALSSSLLTFIPEYERIGVLEDTLELNFRQQNVVRLIADERATSTRKGVHLMAAFKRLRVDRIIVGELRNSLVSQYLHSLLTACKGNITTIHGGDPFEANEMIVDLYRDADPNAKSDDVKRLVKNTIDLMVFIEHEEGHRYCSSVYFPKYDASV